MHLLFLMLHQQIIHPLYPCHEQSLQRITSLPPVTHESNQFHFLSPCSSRRSQNPNPKSKLKFPKSGTKSPTLRLRNGPSAHLRRCRWARPRARRPSLSAAATVRLLACAHTASKGCHGGVARWCRVELRLCACAGEGCRGGVTISYHRLLGPSSHRSPSCAAAA
jgi:hypothetical protein